MNNITDKTFYPLGIASGAALGAGTAVGKSAISKRILRNAKISSLNDINELAKMKNEFGRVNRNGKEFKLTKLKKMGNYAFDLNAKTILKHATVGAAIAGGLAFIARAKCFHPKYIEFKNYKDETEKSLLPNKDDLPNKTILTEQELAEKSKEIKNKKLIASLPLYNGKNQVVTNAPNGKTYFNEYDENGNIQRSSIFYGSMLLSFSEYDSNHNKNNYNIVSIAE